MRAKEYLLQYRRALEQVERLDRLIESLYTQAEVQASAPKAVTVRGSGRKKDKTSEIAVKIADLSAKMNEERLEALRILEDVADLIDEVGEVSEPVHARILFDRYVSGMDWWQIAEDISYDPAYTRGRLHGSAIQAAQKVLDGKEQHATQCNKTM